MKSSISSTESLGYFGFPGWVDPPLEPLEPPDEPPFWNFIFRSSSSLVPSEF